MNCRTHAVIGSAVALTLLNTSDLKTIIGGTALTVAGSYLVDIDTPKSKGSKVTNGIFEVCIIVGLLEILSRFKGDSLLRNLIAIKSIGQLLPALGFLMVVLIIGKNSTHRGFTHSILGTIAMTVPIYMIFGSLSSWFLVGYVSHILTDMTTKMPVKILYPMKKGFSLGLWHSDGIVDKIMFMGAWLVIIVSVIRIIGTII